MKIKIWIRQNRDVLFKVSPRCYALIIGNNLPASNKREKMRKGNIICLASSLSHDYPPDFIAMYYSEEDIVYWHELQDLIKRVCK